MPDGPAGEVGVSLHDLPALADAFEGLSQGVGVFGAQQRSAALLGEVDQLLRRWVVRCQDVDAIGQREAFPDEVAESLGNADGSRRIQHFHPLDRVADERRVDVLVAHAPEDDAGVMPVGQDGFLGPGEQSVLVVRVSEDAVGRVDRDFADDVEAFAIAQVQEAGVSRIVGGPHGVDVRGLHQLDVPAPMLVGQGPPDVGADFVHVDAAQLDGRAVQLEHASLDLDLAQADRARQRVKGLPLAPQIRLERIEGGRLGGPQPRSFDRDAAREYLGGYGHRRFGRVDRLTVGIGQCAGDRQILRGRLIGGGEDRSLDRKVGLVCDGGVRPEIGQVRLRQRDKRDVAKDAGQRPVVEAVELMTGVALVDADRQQVVSV